VLGVVVGLVVGGTILLATQRYGLLATFVRLAVFTTIANSVQTLDPSHWYFGFSLAVLLQLVAVAAYGFRTSLGERRLLRDEFFG